MRCQIHGIEFRQGQWGGYCPTKIGVGDNGESLYCKEKANLQKQQNINGNGSSQAEAAKAASINLTVARQEASRLAAVMVSAGLIKTREDIESAIGYFAHNSLAWFRSNKE